MQDEKLTRVCDYLRAQGFDLLSNDLAAVSEAVHGVSTVEEEAAPFMLMSDLPDLVLPGFTWHASGYLNVMLYEPTNEEIAAVEKR